MLNRVASLINSDTKIIMGGTFHHVAHVLLRRYAERLGYKSNFSIVDSEDSRQIISTSLAEL